MLGLRFLNRILSIFSSRTTMSTDPFLQFFNSPATMSTTTFLNHFKNLVLLSPHLPENILYRFMVKTVSLNKHTAMASQHEFLSIEIYDTDSQESHLVFLERTMSDSDLPPDSEITDNPYHPFIRRFIQSLPLVSSSCRPTAPADPSQNIPLLAITPSSESLASESSSPSPTPSIRDIASLASMRAMHRSLEVLSGSRRAGDQFVVGRLPAQDYGGGRIMRQLKPIDLTFFQLIILAQTVHDHDPLYTLFKRQCYWYANTIYDAIQQSYRCEIGLGDPEAQTNESHESDLRIPLDLYLPPSAGRWKGVLVMAVSHDVVKDVKKKFETSLLESLAQVKEQWDRANGGNIENASLRARITELESKLNRQAVSST